MSITVIGWLLSGLGWLKQAIAALVGIASRHPWQAACAVLALYSAWLWQGEYETARQRDAARDAVAQMVNVSNKAAATALARRKADEQHYRELADNADAHHTQDTARADRATARYLSEHRLRPASASGPGGAAVAEAQGGDAGVPADSATGTVMVAVSDTDVKACAADYSYAKAAYDWAMALGN
jgi:hypothetical protein